MNNSAPIRTISVSLLLHPATRGKAGRWRISCSIF